MNLKSFYLSLSIFLNSYTLHSNVLEERCSKDVSSFIQSKDGKNLFNALIKKDYYLPCIIRLSSDKTFNDSKRWYIITAMTKLGGKGVLPQLIELKNNESTSWALRIAVAKSLNVIPDAKAIEVLHTMLFDRSLLVRTVVVDLLSIRKDPNSFSYLAKALDSEDNFYRGKSTLIRKHIISSLYLIDSKKAKGIFIKKQDDSDQEVSLRAKKYLALIP